MHVLLRFSLEGKDEGEWRGAGGVTFRERLFHCVPDSMRSFRLPVWSCFCTHPHVDLRVKQLCLRVQNHKKLRAKAPRPQRYSHPRSLFWNFLTRVTQRSTVITRRQHASSACSVRTIKVQAEASYWGTFVTPLMDLSVCTLLPAQLSSNFNPQLLFESYFTFYDYKHIFFFPALHSSFSRIWPQFVVPSLLYHGFLDPGAKLSYPLTWLTLLLCFSPTLCALFVTAHGRLPSLKAKHEGPFKTASGSRGGQHILERWGRQE